MNTKSKKDGCTKHKQEDAREKYKKIMESLPDSQAGSARHKCSYCAYDKGYEKGLEDGIKSLQVLMESSN